MQYTNKKILLEKIQCCLLHWLFPLFSFCFVLGFYYLLSALLHAPEVGLQVLCETQTGSGINSSSTIASDEARVWLDLDLKIKLLKWQCSTVSLYDRLLNISCHRHHHHHHFKLLKQSPTCHTANFDSTGFDSFSRKQNSVQSEVQTHDWHAVR